MNSLFNKYIVLIKNRDFLLLILVIFIGQVASAFLVLSLIASVFKQTGSSFGVSGVILSFAVPGFLLMALAGLAADLFDRRVIILVANTTIALVVLLILVSGEVVYASIPLAFLYFAGNAFFIPASSAATAQLVKKRQLLVANSFFIFALAGGVISGLFVAAVVSFFAGASAVIFVCEILLILAATLSLFLPRLVPRKKGKLSIFRTIGDIMVTFAYIFAHRAIWFFFVSFAVVQGIIAFGITLAPGFFEKVMGISIEKSPILIFPLIGVGVILGTGLIQVMAQAEGLMVSFGIGILGLASLILGLFLRFLGGAGGLLFLPVAVYLIVVGLGAVVVMIASRAAMQREVAHHYQGTVFGANIILASLFSGVLSPVAATFEVLSGFVNILVWGGTVIFLGGLISFYLVKKWRF